MPAARALARTAGDPALNGTGRRNGYGLDGILIVDVDGSGGHRNIGGVDRNAAGVELDAGRVCGGASGRGSGYSGYAEWRLICRRCSGRGRPCSETAGSEGHVLGQGKDRAIRRGAVIRNVAVGSPAVVGFIPEFEVKSIVSEISV